ncbi:MAG: NAD-binding protein, partial [Candidatus Diapherotrites archaeon]
LRDFFATIFFVSLGLQISFAFTSLPFAVLLLMFLVLYFVNPALYFLISILFGLKPKSALFVGLALGQASEFSFILANQGFKLGQLSPEIFSASILAITISMASTPYLMEKSDSLYSFFSKSVKPFLPKKLGSKLGRREKSLDFLPKSFCEDHLVIVGSGLLGKQLISALKKRHKIVVVDHDAEIAQANASKVPTIYGEAESDEILEKACPSKAKAVISTIPDTKAACLVIKKAKKANPKILAIAKAKNFTSALELYKSGADYVLLPEVVSANVLLKQLSGFLETGNISRISNLEDDFRKYLEEKAREEQGA